MCQNKEDESISVIDPNHPDGSSKELSISSQYDLVQPKEENIITDVLKYAGSCGSNIVPSGIIYQD